MNKPDKPIERALNDLPITREPMLDQGNLGLPAPVPPPPREIMDNIVKITPQMQPADSKPTK
jgi:hypothetical protein